MNQTEAAAASPKQANPMTVARERNATPPRASPVSSTAGATRSPKALVEAIPAASRA